MPNPNHESEWALYKVLERANLLQYFDVFISQGGDDVAQLCEASEDEFFEIMALVGMAGKPLHVRRLQKALREWISYPSNHEYPSKGSIFATISNTNERLRNHTNGSSNSSPFREEQKISTSTENKLSSEQVEVIQSYVEQMAKNLPLYAPKPLNSKKQVDKEIEELLNYPDDHPDKNELLRKYGTIYGRFDSKRKSDKMMNWHELCINEAACQLCIHRPALVTRREDLFNLSRQVVKECNQQLSQISSTSRNEETVNSTVDCLNGVAIKSETESDK